MSHLTFLFEKVLSLPETHYSAGLTGQPASPRDPPVYTSLALELQVPGTRQAAYENAGDYGADSHPCAARNFPIELCPSPPGETFQSHPANLQNPFLIKGLAVVFRVKPTFVSCSGQCGLDFTLW